MVELSQKDYDKALREGFEQRLLDDWDGSTHIVGDRKVLYVSPKGRLKVEICKDPKALAGKLSWLRSEGVRLSSASLLFLENQGRNLSPQETDRSRVRAKKNEEKKKKKKKKK